LFFLSPVPFLQEIGAMLRAKTKRLAAHLPCAVFLAAYEARMPVSRADPFLLRLFILRPQDHPAELAKRLAVRCNPYDITCLAAPVALVSPHFIISPFDNSKALIVKVLL
jgi:hypothetical protein